MCCFHMVFIWKCCGRHWSVGSPIKTRWLMVTKPGTMRRFVPCSLGHMEKEHPGHWLWAENLRQTKNDKGPASWGDLVNSLDGSTAVMSSWPEAFLPGEGKWLMETPACLDHTGCFSPLLKQGTLKLELGSLLPPLYSIARAFIMPINQAFCCTCWRTSCRKQVYLGTERMGDCGQCWGLPDVFHLNNGPSAGGQERCGLN